MENIKYIRNIIRTEIETILLEADMDKKAIEAEIKAEKMKIEAAKEKIKQLEERLRGA